MADTSPLLERRQQILVEDGLYSEYDVPARDSEDDELLKFAFESGHVDAYCPACNSPSVYRIVSGSSYGEDKKLPSWGIFSVEARCSRHGGDAYTGKGRLFVTFFRDMSRLVKVGQYPSRADLDHGSLDKVFDSELDPSLRSELSKAVGLRAHGIGVGSFVYLRRIFESLVKEARSVAAEVDQKWDEKAFKRYRMPEKIKALHDYLPTRLVETASLYSIVSKGIHDLTEEECLAHFDLVLQGIQMILSQRHEQKRYGLLVSKINETAGKLKGAGGEGA